MIWHGYRRYRSKPTIPYVGVKDRHAAILASFVWPIALFNPSYLVLRTSDNILKNSGLLLDLFVFWAALSGFSQIFGTSYLNINQFASFSPIIVLVSQPYIYIYRERERPIIFPENIRIIPQLYPVLNVPQFSPKSMWFLHNHPEKGG